MYPEEQPSLVSTGPWCYVIIQRCGTDEPSRNHEYGDAHRNKDRPITLEAHGDPLRPQFLIAMYQTNIEQLSKGFFDLTECFIEEGQPPGGSRCRRALQRPAGQLRHFTGQPFAHLDCEPHIQRFGFIPGKPFKIAVVDLFEDIAGQTDSFDIPSSGGPRTKSAPAGSRNHPRFPATWHDSGLNARFPYSQVFHDVRPEQDAIRILPEKTAAAPGSFDRLYRYSMPGVRST